MPAPDPDLRGIGVRQRTVLRIMLDRGGYPGQSPYLEDAPWPYLSESDMLLILATLEKRSLVRRLPNGARVLTDACRQLLKR